MLIEIDGRRLGTSTMPMVGYRDNDGIATHETWQVENVYLIGGEAEGEPPTYLLIGEGGPLSDYGHDGQVGSGARILDVEGMEEWMSSAQDFIDRSLHRALGRV